MTYTVSEQLDRLPEEMRWTPQWCVVNEAKEPHLLSRRGPYRVSVAESSTKWMDFESAVEWIEENPTWNVGFVLSDTDPFTCIDLDVKDADSVDAKGNPLPEDKWTTPEELELYQRIIQSFNSYTERSRSGKGYHIWVHGNIGAGRRRRGVEIYSRSRLMICTGNVYLNAPVRDGQQLLSNMVGQMSEVGDDRDIELVELPETMSDEQLYNMASTAQNAEKFLALWSATSDTYQHLGYPSQSEADLALMSIFTFYSKSNEQCRRMFRYSGLGKRDKAVKDNRYLNETLKIIRRRQARDEQALEHGSALAEQLVKSYKVDHTPAAQPQGQPVEHVQQEEAPQAQPEPTQVVIHATANDKDSEDHESEGANQISAALSDQGYEKNDNPEIAWPPGLAGSIASFIYQSSPRPVKEIAIVSAMGLLAGICGKAYHISLSGLNAYIILVARSAIGKEAMHSGISLIMNALREGYPGIQNFVDYTDYASGPALMKACAVNQSFVNVCGEFGRKLKRMANELDAPMQSLRTSMTNLYQKSGPASIVGGLGYSNKEGNIGSINGVAYSMIGESTPNTFYDSLTPAMMEDGFLSRFTIVEYLGERPKANPNPIRIMPTALRSRIGDIVVQASSMLNNSANQEVMMDEYSKELFYRFDAICDEQINSTLDESFRQMWNRAHLKALRIAALLAVADNHIHPVVRREHAIWAVDLVRRDITTMHYRMSSGDIGNSDAAREKKILSIMRSYLKHGPGDRNPVHLAMWNKGVIPRNFVQKSIGRVTCFNSNVRMGVVQSMNLTLASLIENGNIAEVSIPAAIKEFNYHGKAYRIVRLPERDKGSF